MVGTRDDEKPFGRIAGLIILVCHLYRNKMILCSVNKQDGNTAVSQRLQCRVFVRGDLQLLAEYFISDNASHVERNMKIIVGHMFPDGMRGCEAAVSNNAAHVIRQFEAGSH